MKKLFACLALTAVLTLSFASCDTTNDDKTIVVGASATPHAEILEIIRDDLAKEGWTLDIRVFDDYILPNTALEEGELDANYFQHTPYLNTFNLEHGTHLSAVAKVHYEPFGIYGSEVTAEEYAAPSFKAEGRTIFIPNDGSNLARALFVLQDEGFISLNDGIDPASESLSVNDIADAKGNDIRPVEAATLTSQLIGAKKGTLAVINGNYAMQAGLSVNNALALEKADGEAATLYANVIAVRAGEEESEKTRALVGAILSEEVYNYIVGEYGGGVLPVFGID